MTTTPTLLQQAYSPKGFRQAAAAVLSLLETELAAAQTAAVPHTLTWQAPEDQLAFWQAELDSQTPTDLTTLLKHVLTHSLSLHSRGYVGHQVAVPLPLTILTSALCAYLNNCTTVYELGMAGNAMEQVVLRRLAQRYGYHSDSTGVITSGGSLGNLTALVTARASLGLSDAASEQLAILVSAEAHYSVERAAAILGLQAANVLKVPVGEDLTLRTDLLEPLYQQATAAGKRIFCVVGCAGTTSVGAHDDLEAIGSFARRHHLWFHVDGAHGGAAIFSEKYRHLLRGIETSDSLIVDLHKMMMVPPLSTVLLYNAANRKVQELSPQAAYLWQDPLAVEWYHSAKHTLECTKPITILHTYAILRLYGDALYRQNVDTLYDLGQQLAGKIRQREGLELALNPTCNIICFRYLPKDGSDPDDINRRILQAMLQEGAYYLVGTTVRTRFYLRTTLMNPLTTPQDLERLLDRILAAAASVGKEG